MEGNKARASKNAAWTTDPDDAHFAGASSEADYVLEAVGELIGDELTMEQGEAAKVMARLKDPFAVDKALGLAPVKVRTWMDNPVFFERVVEESYQMVAYSTPRLDYGKALTAKQRTAASMRGLDRMSQIETAAAIG